MKFASRFMWLTTLCVGATGGLLASLVGWPLPWVIGSLVLIIIVRCCGWLVPEIPEGRKVGQLIVAIAIGCHFTSTVLQQVFMHLGIVMIAIVLTLGLAMISIRIMQGWGVGFSTAYFALMPANSTEMIHLARQRCA